MFCHDFGGLLISATNRASNRNGIGPAITQRQDQAECRVFSSKLCSPGVTALGT
jgi:hypothetical protein